MTTAVEGPLAAIGRAEYHVFEAFRCSWRSSMMWTCSSKTRTFALLDTITITYKYTNTQIYKHTNMQTYKHANIQMCKPSMSWSITRSWCRSMFILCMYEHQVFSFLYPFIPSHFPISSATFRLVSHPLNWIMSTIKLNISCLLLLTLLPQHISLVTSKKFYRKGGLWSSHMSFDPMHSTCQCIHHLLSWNINNNNW